MATLVPSPIIRSASKPIRKSRLSGETPRAWMLRWGAESS
jgi:hypothetical protein